MYLKKLGLITIAFLWAFNLTAAEEKVLNVYNWSDYIGEETLKKFRGNMWDGEFLLTASEEDVAQFTLPMLVLMGDDLYHPQITSRKIADLAPSATLVEHWKNPETLQRTDLTIRSFLSDHS